MRTRGIFVACGLAFLVGYGVMPTASWGQETTDTAPKPPKPPSFSTLFPKPTNNNGYEEWVTATDLIRNNAKVEELTSQEGPTLAFKRQVLNDPEVMRALQLVRAGLDKPVYSPRTDLNETTPLPELMLFRQLGRLLAAEQYVAFADGRVDAAINSMRTGIAFGYRIQTDNILSGLTGVAIDAIVLREFSKHLDQLSIHQCNDVRRIVEDFLGAENPALHLLALERGYELKILEGRRSNPDALLDLLKSMQGDPEEESSDLKLIQVHLKNNPADVNAMIDDAQSRVNALYDQALINMRLPLAQRRPLAQERANTPGAALFRACCIDPQYILDRYSKDQDQLRLIGVHVLIHRYRWDHNTLPTGLAELRAPNMIKDAFAGTEVLYAREGDRYTLTSMKPGKRAAE